MALARVEAIAGTVGSLFDIAEQTGTDLEQAALELARHHLSAPALTRQPGGER